MSDLTEAIVAELKDQGGCRYKEPQPREEERPGVWAPVSYVEKVDIGVVNVESLAAAVEAHLRPIVTTVAELDALPDFTIIGAPVRDDDGVVAAWMPFLKSPGGPWYSGDQEVEESELPELFAEGNPTVLYRPA